ncbi:hypothetical protein [Gloeocapsopsis sp. IPPAS B-1203]|uniref:hypothetical protein n=1 Tax=Gloeocapsopsis sp. IPPAS B-1203 TaxID=2049454 RepID=UPI000C1A08E3|nr:hypothetical protein [Gloeocapsopsis sp. IPPAS B-1203]PIG90840.1 hypothetical protein CSQ79_24650 [Gloeocapsopsis sp. IPPAS B-1203]
MWKFKLGNLRKEDRFPQVLSAEAIRLNAAITKVKQRGLEPDLDSEIQEIIRDMIVLMPFAKKFREIGQAVQSFCSQQDYLSTSETKIAERQIFSLYFELESDKSFQKFYKALKQQGISELPFLKD